MAHAGLRAGSSDEQQRPARLRCPQRRPQGGGRGNAPARAGAAGGGRTDRLRPDRHPAPVAAAHLAPSQAAGRGRADRALPRGHLGVLPPVRTRRRGGGGARAAGAARSRRPDHRARPRPAGLGARRPRRRGAGLFSRARRRMGPHPQTACDRRRRSKTRSARRWPTSRSARCSISAPAPGACSNCSAAKSSAGSASICRSTCCCWRATGWSAPA